MRKIAIFAEMKCNRVIAAVMSVVVCAFYLLSVMGVDIHIDHHNDKCYVVPLVMGTDCRSIHEDDECCCCHHHERGLDTESMSGAHDSFHEGECRDCENILEVMEITGTDSQNAYSFDFAVYAQDIVVNVVSETTVLPAIAFCRISFKQTPPRISLPELCVLRV